MSGETPHLQPAGPPIVAEVDGEKVVTNPAFHACFGGPYSTGPNSSQTLTEQSKIWVLTVGVFLVGQASRCFLLPIFFCAVRVFTIWTLACLPSWGLVLITVYLRYSLHARWGARVRNRQSQHPPVLMGLCKKRTQSRKGCKALLGLKACFRGQVICPHRIVRPTATERWLTFSLPIWP